MAAARGAGEADALELLGAAMWLLPENGGDEYYERRRLAGGGAYGGGFQALAFGRCTRRTLLKKVKFVVDWAYQATMRSG